jgi:acyl-CoA thioesterase
MMWRAQCALGVALPDRCRAARRRRQADTLRFEGRTTVTVPALHEFDADTAIEAAGVHKYTASVSDRWHALGGGPNGGYLLSVCLRALTRDMPYPDPLVASAFFLRPGVPGPAEIHTEVVRTGRRVAAGEARLCQEGKERVRATATYADLDSADGRTLVVGEAPVLPPPHECVDPLDGRSLPGVSISERVEYRFAEMPGWWQGRAADEPAIEFWMKFRDGRAADVPALPLLVDAAPPAVLAIGEVASSTLQLTLHVRARPAPGWLACRATTRNLTNGHHEEDFEIWDSRGALVAQSRQLALLPPAPSPS